MANWIVHEWVPLATSIRRVTQFYLRGCDQSNVLKLSSNSQYDVGCAENERKIKLKPLFCKADRFKPPAASIEKWEDTRLLWSYRELLET